MPLHDQGRGKGPYVHECSLLSQQEIALYTKCTLWNYITAVYLPKLCRCKCDGGNEGESSIWARTIQECTWLRSANNYIDLLPRPACIVKTSGQFLHI